MRFHRHILRDVFWFTIPIAIVLAVLVISTIASFLRAEITNFHGYPVRMLRVGSPKDFLAQALKPLLAPTIERFLPEPEELARRVDGPRVFDLRVDKDELVALMSDLPASASQWRKGELVENGAHREVEVRHRGQRMSNYFFAHKAWKLKTTTSGMVDGSRTINLTPLEGRIEGHLIFRIADRLGLPVPQSRVCQLYVNRRDQGLYLQEEQVDESLIRRTGRMPGDVFYGELFVPDEPPLSCDDLFWNPYLWVKNDRHNYFDEEHRPYLTALLDRVCDDSAGSFDALYELLNLDVWHRHIAVLCFVGDQHLDSAHNHKLYFSPLRGKFEPVIWNALMNMPRGLGLESMANRFYKKLCRDPRFLDSVHRIVQQDLLEAGCFDMARAEIDRIASRYSAYTLDPPEFRRAIAEARATADAREQTLTRELRVADARWTCRAGATADVSCLEIHVRSAAALRLTSLHLNKGAGDVRLYEDRNGDGALDAGDRELTVRAQGPSVVLEGEPALLYTGRDFRAPYQDDSFESVDAFKTHRQFTRLAYLKSSFLLQRAGGVPAVQSLGAERTVGQSPVDLRRGEADGYVATETVHPWTMPARETARVFQYSGTVEIKETVLVRDIDRFQADPGTTLLLGPEVSLVFYARAELKGLRVRRLDPERPWGVIAFQGDSANGSLVADCDIEGGSHGVVQFIYYSGMVSAHHVEHLTFQDSRFGPNVLGDDTLRFGLCHDLSIVRCNVDRAHGDGIDCDLSSGRIADSTIVNPRNDGVDLMTAQIDIDHTKIRGSGDKGVSIGEGATPAISRCEIEGCVIGLGIKDGSDPIVTDTIIQGCRSGVASYDKNWRYPGGGKGRLVRCTLLDNEVDVRMDAQSVLTLDDCTLSGRLRLPKGFEGNLTLVGTSAEVKLQ